jgi:hypothetical protein
MSPNGKVTSNNNKILEKKKINKNKKSLLQVYEAGRDLCPFVQLTTQKKKLLRQEIFSPPARAVHCRVRHLVLPVTACVSLDPSSTQQATTSSSSSSQLNIG